jgi:lipopolysaccharide/colanic/teichoic acid biosynthesis glycosyltransferase
MTTLSPHAGALTGRRFSASGAGRDSQAIAGAVMRAFDIVAAASVLLLASPLLLLIALLVWMMDGGPAFFSQSRIGRDGRHFRCLKFRTMCVDADARLARLLAGDENARREYHADHKLRVDPRITRLGKFLRKTSLDETPQLFNVLRGEMSLVGPRPIVDAEVPRYGHRFSAYCAQRPGITGLWQVSGRNDVSYRRRVALDTTYSARKSLALDMRILVATVPAVVLRRGSY